MEGVYRWGGSNFLHTMVYGLAFLFRASIFRWTQLILLITFGKLFPSPHYILQIGIHILNVPEGYFTASFQVLDLPRPNIMGTELQPDNACIAINDEVTLWWDDAINFLMLISLLSTVKTFMYSSVNDQLIFLKFEKSNTHTLILRFIILSLG